MTVDEQIRLRDELLSHLRPAIEKGNVDLSAIVGSATAAIGAAAIVVALLPSKEARAMAVAMMVEHLAEVVEKRATELRSGALDEHLHRGRH